MSEEKKECQPQEDQADDELSNLLDSALEDFITKEKKTESQKENKTEDGSSNSDVVLNSQEWSNDFVQQAANQFDDRFSDFLAGIDPNAQLTPELLQQRLQQMADAAQQVLDNPQVSDTSSDIAGSISQAIQGLSAGAEGLQEPLIEEELMKMFSGSGQENSFLPFMQGMMQGLLSKEVLGPSLEDFVQRLPPYIEENKDKLSKEDIERYENQKKLMEEVLAELNQEKDTDTSDVKKERFTRVLALMQKLQDYGQPPSELVGNVDVPFNFDSQGNPVGFPDVTQPPQDCSIM